MVAIFIGKMLKGEMPVINGTGNQERDFVYVADVANASVLALDRAGGAIVNVGSGVGTSVNRIYELLKELSGFQRMRHTGRRRGGKVDRIFLQSARARDQLNWKPEISLCDGLARTVEFFKTTPHNWR